MSGDRHDHILVIEDDTTLSRLLVDQLGRLGYPATAAGSMAAAEEVLASLEPTLVMLDMRLPDASGLEVIGRFRDLCPVIILTAYGSIEQAVQAVQAGATDFLVKPVARTRLEIAVRRALEAVNLRRRIERLETQVRSLGGLAMIGHSRAFRRVEEMVGLVAGADTTVLVEGESGTGKELVARAIHEASARKAGQLVTIDCATLQENLLESELFGHERGAFTGADRRKEGLVELAEGGTVFLDEIGEISPAIQAKLLRILETGRFRRLGGTRDLAADVRFVAATNRPLEELARAGNFRSDLYYRLSAFTITVPPLRERREDILPIARHFLVSRSFMRTVRKDFHPSAEEALVGYSWPGNVRELRNVVERGLLMSAGDPLVRASHLSLPEARGAAFELAFDHLPQLAEVRARYMAEVLQRFGGNKARAARAMGISERNLYRILSDRDGDGG